MNFLDYEQIVLFHQKIISVTGGSPGVRDRSLIESALNKAFQTFDGTDLFEGTIRKITVISYALIRNHGFVDGNKRIGVATMLLLLKLNNINIEYTQDELVELGLRSAAGEITEQEYEEWIIRHQV